MMQNASAKQMQCDSLDENMQGGYPVDICRQLSFSLIDTFSWLDLFIFFAGDWAVNMLC